MPAASPPAFIVDASVLVAAVKDEPSTASVQRRLARASAETHLLVPALARSEVLNALLRAERRDRRRLDETRLRRALEDALRLTTEVVDPPGVLALAMKHGLSAYDATYLALTLDSGPRARLWTLDAGLARAAAAEGVLASDADLDA